MEYIVGLVLISSAFAGLWACIQEIDRLLYKDSKRTAKTLRIKRKF